MKSPSRDVTESSPSQRPALENKRTEFNNEEEVEKQVKKFMNNQLKTFRTFLNQLEVMQVPGTKINEKIDEIRRKGELSMKILKEGRDLFRNSQEPSVKNGQDRRQYPPVPRLQQGDAVSVVNSSVTGKSSNYNEKWIQPSDRRYLASPLCKLPSSPSASVKTHLEIPIGRFRQHT